MSNSGAGKTVVLRDEYDDELKHGLLNTTAAAFASVRGCVTIGE